MDPPGVPSGVVLDVPSDAQIIGWSYRGIFDDPRLTEIANLYKALGFMVRITPIARVFSEKGCDRCFKETPEKFKALYTKKIDTC